jgi:arginine N-succinyltransferase
MYIRPVTREDHAALLSLAQQAGIGMTSLPPDAEVLQEKIERAVRSFSGECRTPAKESYLFVLEDPVAGQVVGVSGVLCHVGLRQPFYSYKLSTITQVSESLEIFSQHQTLSVVNDYTGCSEIGSLYLAPEYRRDGMGRLLSRMRFLFMAQFRERFAERTFAEIRGVHEPGGHAPFYDSLAKKFFQIPFAEADYLCATKGNQFIADLVPKYPIYVSLLPKRARDVIGHANIASEPAKALLEREGFRWNGYLDIFDGGPTLDAETDAIRTLRESRLVQVAELRETVEGRRVLAGTLEREGFRAASLRVEALGKDAVALSRYSAGLLGISAGETLRIAEL